MSCLCECVRECQSDQCHHRLACGSHWRRQKDLQATGLIDTSHFRCLCSGWNMEAREIRGSINREEEVERKRDEVERWRGENGWREGGQHRREEELLRASRAVNILQAWIREVMKCGMGEGFLRASYRVKERKGAGQLDNTALIKNICRWRGRKTASGGREMTAFCFICLSGQVSVFVFFFVWFLISVLISSRLFWRDPTWWFGMF